MCELWLDSDGPTLYVYIGNQLVRKEDVTSAVAAFDVATELSKRFRVPIPAHG